MPAHLFLSYNHSEELQESFVQKVWSLLRSQPDVEPFLYPEAPAELQAGNFWTTVKSEIAAIKRHGGLFVLFVGETLGDTQQKEMAKALEMLQGRRRLWVGLAAQLDPTSHLFRENCISIEIKSMADPAAEKCAQELIRRLGRRWQPPRGIPPGYPFAFEREIIQLYKSGRTREWLPPEWPQARKQPTKNGNPVDPARIGTYRDEDAAVAVYARMEEATTDMVGEEGGQRVLTFPEAGPRARLLYPLPHQRTLRVGVLVSGGIAPGINAVIDGIVARHIAYMRAHNNAHPGEPYKLEVRGYLEGLKALLRGGRGYRDLHDDAGRHAVTENSHVGGSLLGTSRAESLLELAPEGIKKMESLIDKICDQELDILYVIGGDGSMRAAHAISVEAGSHEDERAQRLSVVGIPKTTDNDILWVWQSFGFLTAVDEATRITRGLHTETTSNPRVIIIQLFGSDSGFVVSHAALGSGVCDAALIPEVPFNLEKLSGYMCEVLRQRYDAQGSELPHGIVVMAETAIPTDFKRYIADSDDPALTLEEQEAVWRFVDDDRRVRGQTPDLLRSAALKMVSRELQRAIKQMGDEKSYWNSFRVFTNEPRHIIRSSAPTVSDAVLAGRLGTLAVDNAMAGYSDFMVSQWLTEYVLVPLELVVLGRKRVPEDGIFWKTVVASLEAHSNVPVDFFERPR